MTEKQSTAVAVKASNGLVPTSLDEMLAQAQKIVKSGLVPESIRTPEAALVVMLKGREMGLKPMQALAHIYVVNGQAAIDTKLLVALYESRGHTYQLVETTAERCVIEFHLRGDARIYRYELTMAEVQAAHWNQSWSKEKNAWVDKPTWKSMPRVMLRYATLRTGIRAYAPACLFGMVTVDEAESVVENGHEARLNELLDEPIEGEAREVTAPESSKPHWITRPEVRKAFWRWAREDMALSDEQIHTMLGVEHVEDYRGTMKEARSLIETCVAEEASEDELREEEDSEKPAAQQEIPF